MIKIAKTDRLGRTWEIVSVGTGVGFSYSIALRYVETDKGWTDLEHTAENVQRLLSSAVELRFSEVA